jgi:hypothetical protein
MIAKSLRLLAGLALAVFFTGPAGAAETAGSWTIRPSDTPDKVQLTFVYDRNIHSTDWRVSDLKGLQLASDEQRHDVRFLVERDAGRIEAEGVSTSGTAAGSFRFLPDPDYAGEMRKLGVGEIKSDSLLSLALHDISRAYVRDMAALGLGTPTVGRLLAFRIHGVDPAYVKDLRAAGVQPDADELIAFRIHGVTPDFVAALRKLGYDAPAPGQLIAMRIHGVTPDYIASVKARGVRDTSLDQLVAMKIQGID